MKIQSIFKPIPVFLMLSLSMMLWRFLSCSNEILPANDSSEGAEVDLLLDSNELASLPLLLNSLQSWQAEGKVSEYQLIEQNRLRLWSDSSTIEALRALPVVSEVVEREEGMSISLTTSEISRLSPSISRGIRY